MGLAGFETKRRIFDTIVVLVSASSAYIAGFIRSMDIGSISTAVSLPILFIISMCFMHLVLRRGRELDKGEHALNYEVVKAVSFILMLVLSYRAGVTAEQITAGLTSIVSYAALLSTGLNVYLMAYRANN